MVERIIVISMPRASTATTTEAKLPGGPLEAISHIVTAPIMVSSRIAARKRLRDQPTRSSTCGEQSHGLLEVLLQFGRQRSVEIIGDVGDAEEVLPKSTLLSGRLIRHELRFRLARLSDDDLLAGGSSVHQLGEVRLRIVDVDRLGHGP